MKRTQADNSAHARQARYWLLRLVSGDCNAQELQALQQWLAQDPSHRSAFEQQRRLWQQLGAAREPVLQASAALPRQSWHGQRRSWRPLLATLGVAALICVLAGPTLMLQLRADHHSGSAPSALTLDDGSRVVLDADSAIALDYSAQQRRVVLLRGRAWFDVVHEASRTFQVDALGGSSRDIGTRFAVAVQHGQVRTEVEQGEVEVRPETDAQPLRLHAGQAVVYREDGEISAPLEMAADSIGAWRRGQLLLEAVDGRTAIQQIARYRRAPVWLIGSVSDRGKISAAFRTDRPEQAITAIAEQLRLQVHHLPGDALLLMPSAR